VLGSHIIANWPSWLTSPAAPDWAVAVGTVVLAFVAIFQQWLQRIFIRPRLHLDVRVARPDAEKTRWNMILNVVGRTVKIDADAYYFRLAITNVGNAAAHDVQVYLGAVERLRADQKYEGVERFSPMSLKWAHTGATTRPILLPKMPPLYCDMAHISDPKYRRHNGEDLPGIAADVPLLALDLEVLPNSGGHLLEPGTYRFHLTLAASDHPPQHHKLEVVFQGKWHDDQDKMFGEGFGMRLL
jgi:hypothetical protein